MCEHPYSLSYKTFKPWFGYMGLQDHFPHFKQSQTFRSLTDRQTRSEYVIFPRKTTLPDLQQKKKVLSHIWPNQSPNPQRWADFVILLTCCLQGIQNCSIGWSLLKIVCASYNLFYCMNWLELYVSKSCIQQVLTTWKAVWTDLYKFNDAHWTVKSSSNSFTIKLLNIRTPKKFAVIPLKFEQDGFTKE